MKLSDQASKYFYLGCLFLVLYQFKGHLTKTRAKSYLDTSRQFWSQLSENWRNQNSDAITFNSSDPSLYLTPPLMMRGGDPYIRALMRTITASEANVSRPYNVIYGGSYVEDLSSHPEICVPILVGPNLGQCTTAAGRYQMLDFTWNRQAQQYHPQPSGIWHWKTYSFEAEYQDHVVHDWLSDYSAWKNDIPRLLREGEVEKVLKLLSSTWTSLGYGIETNSMSVHLPDIYVNTLKEEEYFHKYQ